jgi:hypothetical protein
LLYLPFSRHPDYFDSETAPAIIQYKGDTVVAAFSEYGKPYYLPLNKLDYRKRVGEKVEVIYELRDPQNAKINTPWGYWFLAEELAWSIGLFFVLLGIAYATTHRPHPDALAEQLNYKAENKTKYD